MRFTIQTAVMLVTGLALTGPHSQAQDSILVDGDFASVAPNGSTASIRYCSGPMGAWIIPEGQGVEVINPVLCGCLCGGGPCYGNVGCAPRPGPYLRLHNNYWQCSYGPSTSISQEVPVIPGHLYELSLDAASELGNTIEVADGTRVYQFGTGNGWQRLHAFFRWAQPTGLVRITRLPVGANNPCSGPFISNVALVYRGSDCNQNMIPDDLETDCNHNLVPDSCDIANGTSTDFAGDGVPDECQCLGDLFMDGLVNGVDLGVLLAYWGPTTSAAASQVCDINRDQAVDGLDLGILLSNWGPCSGG